MPGATEQLVAGGFDDRSQRGRLRGARLDLVLGSTSVSARRVHLTDVARTQDGLAATIEITPRVQGRWDTTNL